MDRPSIDSLRIQNFASLEDVTLWPTALHALVGPADAGKSMALRALRLLSLAAAPRKEEAPELADLQRFCTNLARTGKSPRFVVEAQEISMSIRPKGPAWSTSRLDARTSLEDDTVILYASLEPVLGDVVKPALAGSHLIRFQPQALRKAAPLIPDGAPLRFLDEKGAGLPAIYDAILSRDTLAFLGIVDTVRRLFPAVQGLRLVNATQKEKLLSVQLKGGAHVPSDDLGDGLLYMLGFLALRHLEPAALVLIEAPEVGLHPSRVREVIKVLRDVSRRSQVILTTYSPTVLDELGGHEITLLTRPGGEATRAVLLKDTPRYASRAERHRHGEMWYMYSDGDAEKGLTEG